MADHLAADEQPNLEYFPAGLAVLVGERLVQRNAAFDNLLGVGPGTPDDGVFQQTLPEKDFARLQKYLQRCSPTGITVSTSVDATERHFHLVAAPGVYNGSNAHFITLVDQTVAYRLRQSLERTFDFFTEQLAVPKYKPDDQQDEPGREQEDYRDLFEKLTLANHALQRDLDLAIRVQQGRLPSMPASNHWKISFVYRPMAGVSGDIIDIYDFSDVLFFDDEADENLGVILLDASGHGMSAALVTAVARPIFYELHRANKNGPLHQAFMDSNVELCRELGPIPNYLTGVSVRLRPDSFSYVNAAHPLLMFRRAASRKVHEFDNDGILLGIPELKGDFRSRTVKQVNSGDIIFMYSDCLSESLNANGEEFGVERVREALSQTRSQEPAEIQAEILAAWQDFGINPDELQDDLSMVVIVKK